MGMDDYVETPFKPFQGANSAQAGSIASMKDVIDSGQNLCVRTAIESTLLSRYPEMTGEPQGLSLFVLRAAASQMRDALGQGAPSPPIGRWSSSTP